MRNQIFSSPEFKLGLSPSFSGGRTQLYVPANSLLVTFDPSGYFGQS